MRKKASFKNAKEAHFKNQKPKIMITYEKYFLSLPLIFFLVK